MWISWEWAQKKGCGWGEEVKDFIEKVECLMEQVLAEQGGDGAINTDKV